MHTTAIARSCCMQYSGKRSMANNILRNAELTLLITPSTALISKRHTSIRKHPARMRAWQIHQYGGNEELAFTDSARVAAINSPNELLIKVHASSINPIDVHMRGGYGSKMMNILRKRHAGLAGSEFPMILGRDFSGVVVETGQAVKTHKPGDEVWGTLNWHRQGSHAELAVAAESEISSKPRVLSHVEAASIPYVAATSWTALSTVGELKEKNARGKRVLILGASGGIGTFSVQLLKAWGANVTATCATDAVDLVKLLGADTVLDYKTENVITGLRRLPPFDFILDTVGGKTANDAFALLKRWRNAKLVTLVTPLLTNTDTSGILPGLATASLSLGSNIFRGLIGGQHYRWAFFLPNGKALCKVGQLVDRGQIRPVVEKEFAFNQLPEAFAFVEKGHNRGKTVIQM